MKKVFTESVPPIMGTRKRRRAASAGARLAAGSFRNLVSRQGDGQKSHPSGSFVTDKHLSAPIDFICSQKSGCFWPGAGNAAGG
jgi:hypothetical protein